jgi:PAS domain S-box-containing protein
VKYLVKLKKVTENARRITHHKDEIESLLAAILGVVGVPLLITDQQDRIRMLSPAVTATFGWPMQEVLGRTLSNFVKQEDPSTSTAFRCKDVSDKLVELSSVPVRTEDRCWTIVTCTSRGRDLADQKTAAGDFAAAIRKCDRQLVAGRIQMVSLDEVQNRLGERWEKSAERILTSAQSIIASRLGREDVFSRNADGQFIICFADFSEAEATFKARAIQKEIRDKLIGEGVDPELATFAVETHTISISDAELESTEDFAAMIAKKLAQAAERIQQAAERLLSDIVKTAVLRPQKILTVQGKPSGYQKARFDAETEAKLSTIISSETDTGIMSKIDALILARTSEYIIQSLVDSGRCSLISEIHFSSLYHRKYREGILLILRQLPDPVRNAFILGIRGLDPAIWAGRVTEILGSLRTVAQRRMVHAENLCLGNVSLRDAGVSLVSIDYSALLQLDGTGVKTLSELRDQVARTNAELLIEGIPDARGIALARQVGAHFVTLDGTARGTRLELMGASG